MNITDTILTFINKNEGVLKKYLIINTLNTNFIKIIQILIN